MTQAHDEHAGTATVPGIGREATMAEQAAAFATIEEPAFIMRPVRDGDHRLVDLEYAFVNDAGLRLYQRTAAEVIGHLQCELFPSVRELGILAAYAEVLDTGVPSSFDIPTFDENGIAGSFSLNARRVHDTLVIVAHDITAQRRAERDLTDRTEQLRAILDGSLDGISRYGPDLRFEYVNERVANLSGFPADQWIGRTHTELGYPAAMAEDWDRRITEVFHTGLPATFTYEVDNSVGHGWWEASLAPEFGDDGSVTHVISTNRDVTARVVAQQELLTLATHDPLTGLANRNGLAAELDRALRASSRSGRPTAVLMIDLDRFKLVNDARGHSAGDRLLQAAADRLASVARGGDFLARAGGDEFIVVMRDVTAPAEAVSAAWRMVKAFRGPFLTIDGEAFATISIGVAVTTDTSTGETILRDADGAMHAAKAEGRDRVCVYNESLRVLAERRLVVERELRHALERGELEVWYQPEIDLRTGRMEAVEALLRWHHPQGDVLTAERFVDVAEETGLILEIGSWVLDRACHDGATWAALRPADPLTVRVNLSALQLDEPDLLNELDHALHSSGLPPRLLCAEITETVWLHGTASVKANLNGIRARGVHLAIDDFGTGYAALTYLRQYPIDVLKIDRSFVTSIGSDEQDRRLVAGIVALAEQVGVTVTAEGVEHLEQARVLRSLGCPTAQGFLYSRAVPAPEITALLEVSYPSD